MRQKSLYFICHSGLDPESSVSELDSRLRGNDGLRNNAKKCWTHYHSYHSSGSVSFESFALLQFSQPLVIQPEVVPHLMDHHLFDPLFDLLLRLAH